MILPPNEERGPVWDQCGRIASHWLTLVRRLGGLSESMRQLQGIIERPKLEPKRCDVCGQTPCRWSVPCGTRAERRRLGKR